MPGWRHRHLLDIDGLTSQQVVDLVLRRTGWPDGAGPP